ncbi:Ca2+-binding protein, RTX toxin-related [Nocardioides alpinus]|uniref:Ca2+-binding protein, RTX toxin-related n=1 Tax=Nocardioides alpinus TaxID=748909 RepID=A0A1I1B8V4_9ACTN|nr:calcium-binding protein [Nocardioides alpinus]PKH40464.1 hypothetical protein CXG46_12580 [Nocardioides alpinus]SFB46835.1 Ca2+-binding protein, RTX toxin-related [Nocardioides alpinus]
MRRTHALVPLIALVAPLGIVMGAAGSAAAETTCDGKDPTVVAVAGTPTTGTAGDDVILGTALGDVIDGGAGNDTICGLDGRDTLIGGPGNDRLFGGLDGEYFSDDSYEGDLLVPGPGDDHVDLGDDPQSAGGSADGGPGDYDRVSYRDAAGPVAVDFSTGRATGEGTDTIAVPPYSGGIVGTAFDDVLVGSDARDTIQGGGGDDRIFGRGGDDTLEPDRVGPRTMQQHDPTLAPGDDVVRAGGGADYVFSRLGRDRVLGEEGQDVLFGEGRGSDLGGGDGKDYFEAGDRVSVHGGGGRDEINAVVGRRKGHEVDAGPGRDVVRLTAPKATFDPGTRWVVDVPREKITADGRKRLVYQGAEDLSFSAPRGRLTFHGGAGQDSLYAGANLRIKAFGRQGRDNLVGGRFADLLDGGPGRDILRGDAGRDRCLNGETVRQCEVRR